jgi:choline dehydrogenase-like flavoprotein
MIVDFARAQAPTRFDADLCIVGAGAAGIAIALEFTRTRIKVVLLEGGGERPESDSQGLYHSELRGLRCSTVLDGRARVLGGTTTLWAGQALPLDEIDFAAREWVPCSGWPISLAQLQPYYRRAERLMRLPAVSYGEPGWPETLRTPPSSEGLRRRFSTFARAPNFAASHRAALERAANVTVLLHANATALIPREDGARLAGIAIASLEGRAGDVRARRYVICCGGVETPRLLLASHGIGNDEDLVGRFFQEHVHVRLPVASPNRRAIARLFHSRRVDGVRHFAKLAATPALQRRERTLNVGADVSYDPNANPALRAIKRREWVAAARHPGQLAAAGYRRAIVGEKASEGFGTIYFCVQTETAPRRESRVTLDRRTDAIGMPRAVVDWRVGEPELRTAEMFAARLDSMLAVNDLGRLVPVALERDLQRLSDQVAGGAHHIGTTRMAGDPRTGVVDRDCRVFGVENLFVAGSGVFPTSGWSNPTLTLLALAYRLADRLKTELGAKPLMHTAPREAVA